MAYFGGQIPRTPDIRQQRPAYFYRDQGEDLGSELAMPTGQQPYDPEQTEWGTQVPNLWPQIEQELRGILDQPRQPFFMGTKEEPLTPEQMEHNKMLMAWKTPSGLSAIETGKYRESQERYRNIDRSEARVANYGKQLLAAFKAEAPKGMIQQLESSYNKSVEQLDKLLGEGMESGYPKYTGKGKMAIEGMEKEPGFFSKLLSGFKDKAQELPPIPAEGFQTPEELMEDPAEQAPQKSTLMLKGLIEAERLMRKYLGKEAETVVDQITQQTKDPNERLDLAIAAVEAKNPESESLKRVRAMRQIWNMTPERKLQQSWNPPGAAPTERFRTHQPRVRKF